MGSHDSEILVDSVGQGAPKRSSWLSWKLMRDALYGRGIMAGLLLASPADVGQHEAHARDA